MLGLIFVYSSDSEGDVSTAKSSVVSLLDALKVPKLAEFNRKRKVLSNHRSTCKGRKTSSSARAKKV